MNTKWIATACLLFIMGLASPVSAQSETFSIEGKLLFNNSGDIFVSLVTEDLFGTPLTGIRKFIIKINQDDIKKNMVSFKFESIAPGEYGIRCFQDVNGNGILDKGMFGPKEPWGMSWQDDKPAGWPKFKHICFEVTANIRNLNIDLRE